MILQSYTVYTKREHKVHCDHGFTLGITTWRIQSLSSRQQVEQNVKADHQMSIAVHYVHALKHTTLTNDKILNHTLGKLRIITPEKGADTSASLLQSCFG